MASKKKDFLVQLQHQAELQSRLHKQRLLPKQLDVVTSFIGNYPWQFLLFSSGMTALLWTILVHWDIPFI